VEGICTWATAVAYELVAGIESQRYGVWAHAQAEALVEELAHFSELGGKVLDQARRRVLHGESVPNDEKLFSLFEPHTELLKRGKAGQDIEFGHMIQIQQVGEKFITAYEVYGGSSAPIPRSSPPTRATTRAWISSANSRRRSTSSRSRRRESGRRRSRSESRIPSSATHKLSVLEWRARSRGPLLQQELGTLRGDGRADRLRPQPARACPGLKPGVPR
jgi:hypothetical protein